MEQKKLGNTTEIRIYTGNGFEDFAVGEFVVGNHIFSEVSTRILQSTNPNKLKRKVLVIEVWSDVVIIDFDTGESFEYSGLKYRHSGIYNANV